MLLRKMKPFTSPPETLHNVKNNSDEILEYVYVVTLFNKL